MTNKEKAREIAGGLNSPISGYEAGEYDGALEMAKWKDKHFKEYLEENLPDIVYECIEEYKKIKGSINDDGALRSDYQLAQDIAITLETKIINELFRGKSK